MAPGVVRIWLLAGLIMVFVQIIVGGVTRLTGSGLSITEWEIVTGTLPPLKTSQWEEAFDKYRNTPQYHKINRGMTLNEFKFIYFWEYFHRLWARLMGFVFVLPLIWFVAKGWLTKELKIRVGVVFLLAVLVASFGWIMVASGLIDRPWVNAYKLSVHLGLGFLLFGYLFWTWLHTVYHKLNRHPLPGLLILITILFIIQLLFGGLMSGMKAGLYYPTWPDMHGAFIPEVLLTPENWRWGHLKDYDDSVFTPSLVQFFHRITAYGLLIAGIIFAFKSWQQDYSRKYRSAVVFFIFTLLLQIILGVITVLQFTDGVPVFWGVLHQAGAILFMMSILYLVYLSKTGLSGKLLAKDQE